MYNCPTYAYDDCPYCRRDGVCTIDNPVEECEEAWFASLVEGDDEE